MFSLHADKQCLIALGSYKAQKCGTDCHKDTSRVAVCFLPDLVSYHGQLQTGFSCWQGLAGLLTAFVSNSIAVSC